jgi:CRISPR system Cascade subunit CasE
MYFSRVRVKADVRELSHLNHLLRGNGYATHQLLFDLFPGARDRILFREEIAGEQIPHVRGARGEPIFYVVSPEEPIKNNALFMVETKEYEPRLKVGDLLSFKLRANPVQTKKQERVSEDIDLWRKKRAKQGVKEKYPTKKRIRHDVVINAQVQLLHDLAGDFGIDKVGKKSDLKRCIFDAWTAADNATITAKLNQIIKDNERYCENLERILSKQNLLDMALKAAADKALEIWLINKGDANGFVLVRDKERNPLKRDRLRFQAEGYRWHPLPNKGRTAGFSSVDFEGVLKVTDLKKFVEDEEKNALFNGIGPAKGFGCGLMMVRRV